MEQFNSPYGKESKHVLLSLDGIFCCVWMVCIIYWKICTSRKFHKSLHFRGCRNIHNLIFCNGHYLSVAQVLSYDCMALQKIFVGSPLVKFLSTITCKNFPSALWPQLSSRPTVPYSCLHKCSLCLPVIYIPDRFCGQWSGGWRWVINLGLSINHGHIR